jgi:glutaredoxin
VAKPHQPGSQTVITLVHTAGCHYCADARTAFEELGREYPLRVDEVDAATPEGLALLAEHRVPMFPLVLVDGRFFSYGRLSRGRLRRLLDARQPAGTR